MVIDVFIRSIFDLFHPRMILAILASLILVLVTFLVLFYLSFGPVSSWMENLIFSFDWARKNYEYFQHYFSFSLFPIMSLVLLILLFFPLSWFFCLVFINFISFPLVFHYLDRQDTLNLERRGSFALIKSLKNSSLAFLVFILLWLMSLPFWLLGIGPLLTFLILARFNTKVFSYDSLVDFANRNERREIVQKYRWDYFFLGLLLSLTLFIPFLNLAAPILGALAFTRYSSARLRQFREINTTK